VAARAVEEVYAYDGLVFLLRARRAADGHWDLGAYPALPDGVFAWASDDAIAYDLATSAVEGLALMKAAIRERADRAAGRIGAHQRDAAAVHALVGECDERVTGPWRPVDPGDLPPFERALAQLFATGAEPAAELARLVAAAGLPPHPLLPHADAADRLAQAAAILRDAGAWPWPGRAPGR
jgi:hypothetical protein